LVPRDKCLVVVRTIPEVITDSSADFRSGRTVIRCILLVGFGFPHQHAIVKVVIDGNS
jgi:hypothetical protein